MIKSCFYTVNSLLVAFNGKNALFDVGFLVLQTFDLEFELISVDDDLVNDIQYIIDGSLKTRVLKKKQTECCSR